MFSVVVKKYGDPDILEYVKSDSQDTKDKCVKINVKYKQRRRKIK